MNAGEYRERIDHQNVEARESLAATAAALRRKLIDSAYEAVSIYLEMQEEAMDEYAAEGYPATQDLDYYVLESELGLPFEEDEPQTSLCILLRPDTKLGQEDRGQYMRVHIPVGEDVTLDEHLDTDAIEKPKFIVIEYSKGIGDPTSYKIEIDTITPFVSAALSGEQETPVFEDEVWNATRRVNSETPLVSLLYETYANWTISVQRTQRFDTFEEQ